MEKHLLYVYGYATNILLHLTLDRLINWILNSIFERHLPYCGKLSSAAMKFCIMHDCLVGLRSGQVIFIMEGQKLLTLSPTHVVI